MADVFLNMRRIPNFNATGDESDPDMLKRHRERFSPGTRVFLVEEMDDPDSPPIETEGTVIEVDDLGTVFVRWDNGIRLGAIYECDLIDTLD